MPRNDDGEFELVLGNRQLLSVFFIVVILLGVFFTMGYIVGRNSAPVLADVPKKTDKPLTVDASSAAPAPEPAEPKETPAPKETAQQLPPETHTEAAETKPGSDETSASPKPVKTTKENTPKTDKGERKVESKAETKIESKAESKKETARAAASNADEPAAGRSYLQLAATTKREADVMVDVLRQKGFKALAAEIQDRPGMFRVLVGPVPDGGRNNLRAELQKSGFPGNAAIPRTF